MIDENSLVGKTSDFILNSILSLIESKKEKKNVKKDDILRDKNKKRIPNLKIYIIKNNGINPKKIIKLFHKQLYDNPTKLKKSLKQFIDDYPMVQKPLNDEFEYLEVTNKENYKKYQFFIFYQNPKYWNILTLTPSTELKIIKNITTNIEQLDIIKLTPRHLEDFANKEEYQKFINGFTAKYKPYYTERDITLQVYGGSLEDLNKIREVFFVEPNIVNFTKTNSPITAGKVSSEGFYSLQSISNGFEGIQYASGIINSINEFFVETNEINYEELTLHDNKLISSKSNNSLLFTSSASLIFSIKEERFLSERKDFIKMDEFCEKIKEFLKNHNHRYSFYNETDSCFVVFDKYTRNSFQISIEPKHKNIILYPYGKCRDSTFRYFSSLFTSKVESSMSSIKTNVISY